MLIVADETVLKVMKLVGGEDAVKIVKLLMKKPLMSDEEIASTLNMDVKEVRKILHKLAEQSLLGYEVARDKETGHRIFKWKVQNEQVIGFIRAQLKRMLEKLKAKLEYEQTHQFYHCGTNGCRKYSFEEAVDMLFKCPVCGKPLNYYDNSKIINALKKKIEELERYASF